MLKNWISGEIRPPQCCRRVGDISNPWNATFEGELSNFIHRCELLHSSVDQYFNHSRSLFTTTNESKMRLVPSLKSLRTQLCVSLIKSSPEFPKTRHQPHVLPRYPSMGLGSRLSGHISSTIYIKRSSRQVTRLVWCKESDHVRHVFRLTLQIFFSAEMERRSIDLPLCPKLYELGFICYIRS